MRISTTLLVVLFHAALAYLAIPLRHTLWVVQPGRPSAILDYLCYGINGFAMPVFFLAAGVSAPAALKSRGAYVFLTHRARRLLRPLAFGCLTVLPIVYVIWGYGLLATGRCDLDEILSWRFRPGIRENLYGLGHLWFLEYLFLVCVVWCVAAQVCRFALRGRDEAEEGWISRIVSSAWAPIWLAVPTAAIFLIDTDAMLRIGNSVIPDPIRLLHYAYFFAVGGWISRMKRPVEGLIRRGIPLLALAVLDFTIMSPLLLRHAGDPLQGSNRVVLCLMAAVFPWLLLFGSLGVLLRVGGSKGPVLRYLSESSFWVFIVHLPMVAIAQALLLPVALPAEVKFALVSAFAVSMSLLSYEFVARFSLVGEIINGSRKRSKGRGFAGPELGWIACLTGILLVFAGGAWYARVFFWGNNLYEEVPGQLYRSARLPSKDLDRAIAGNGLRSVVTIGGGDHHPWYRAQESLCRSRKVDIYAITLRNDRVPARDTVQYLINLLDQAPRPVLVQGYRGIDHAAFASAVDRLLRGAPPEVALREFAGKYGQVGGAEHSVLGRTLLEYRDWLRARHEAHTAERFRGWARDRYPVEAGAPSTKRSRRSWA